MQVQSPRSERDKDSICHREIQKSKYQHRAHLPKGFMFMLSVALRNRNVLAHKGSHKND